MSGEGDRIVPFVAKVQDSGGGMVSLLVGRDTAEYPVIGADVVVLDAAVQHDDAVSRVLAISEIFNQGGKKDRGPGVWLAYYSDWSGMAVFSEEIEALRAAVGSSMSVCWLPFGMDLREAAR